MYKSLLYSAVNKRGDQFSRHNLGNHLNKQIQPDKYFGALEKIMSERNWDVYDSNVTQVNQQKPSLLFDVAQSDIIICLPDLQSQSAPLHLWRCTIGDYQIQSKLVEKFPPHFVRPLQSVNLKKYRGQYVLWRGLKRIHDDYASLGSVNPKNGGR